MNYEVHRKGWSTLTGPTRIAALILLLTAILAATALGCGWFGETGNSVRFSYGSETERASLPPLPNSADEETAPEDNSKTNDEDADYERGQKRSDEVDDLWDRAEAAEQDGQWSLERDLLREYLGLTKTDRDIWFSPTDCQERRNSAFDRLDALSALDRGTKSTRVQQYLSARHLHDEGDFGEGINNALKQIESDVNLKDNVAYLRAAGAYEREQFAEAAEAFDAIARRYPQSEKRQASIFMSAVASMKASAAFTPTSGDEAHLHEYDQSKIHDVVIDKGWHQALSGFNRLIAEYPGGRFLNDARGWVAYLKLRAKDRAGALVEYYRLLSDKNDYGARLEAVSSLERVRHHATEDEMARVEKQLAREPEVALVYAYHTIYNYSMFLDSPYPIYEEVKDSSGKVDYEATRRLQEEHDEQWDKDEPAIQRQTRLRILAFSMRLMESYPNLPISAGFALRAAQASLELDKYENAAQFARRALQSRVNDDLRMQALWTLGFAEHRLRHLDGARKNFNTLLRDYPKSHLTESVRSTLAMISEDEGDLDGALEQYIALEYRPDVAYFVDTLMTIEQLAGFIERHPDSPKINEFTYALGLRYLRANRWDDARQTFARVRTVASKRFGYYGNDCLDAGPCIDPKEPEFDAAEENAIITTQLVMHDVQTANVLEAMEQAVNQAQGDEAKAEALYQLASYQYEQTTLLFYNPVAWRSYRYFDLSELASGNHYRAKNESQTLFAYMQEHDTPARALKIYLEVVNKFPKTRAARDALYTAAVCHERLANYNPYWRNIYAAGLHAGLRMVTYEDVKAAYPNYQLPRGTSGWQPSTRTVNGGPGWAPRPKYVPPPTRMERLKLTLESYVDRVLKFWNETGQRWVTMIVMLVAIWFTARIATQNRKLLRPKLMRLRLATPRQPVESPTTEMFWLDPVGRGDKLKQYLCERGIEFWELMRDRHTRPIMLQNVVSHSFLTVLVVSLFWTVHAG
jgi:TolA-binding protein